MSISSCFFSLIRLHLLRVSICKGKGGQNDRKRQGVFSTSIDTVKPPCSGPSETALRLRSLPEGCPPQAKIFLYLMRIHRSSYWKLSLFCDFRPCILDQISITIMKILNLKNIFKIYVGVPGNGS